jgi:flagellar assembly protein FliH
MSEFQPGFAARHAAAAHLLHQAFAPTPAAFAPVAIGAGAGPKSFHPADPAHKPTAGWNPLDPDQPTNEFLDPVKAAHAAGFEEGQAAALVAAEEERARDRRLLADLVDALGAAGRVDRDRIARQLRQTVMLLVAKLVGEAGVSADLLTARVAAATDLLADAAESAMLRVHPADVALLEGRLPDTIFAVGDAAVARGAFVLESASTVVEDGPELWLEQMAAAIERAAVPE